VFCYCASSPSSRHRGTPNSREPWGPCIERLQVLDWWLETTGAVCRVRWWVVGGWSYNTQEFCLGPAYVPDNDAARELVLAMAAAERLVEQPLRGAREDHVL